jgi:hypothetical protein
MFPEVVELFETARKNIGFNKQGFMEYLELSFNGFENSFLRNLVKNLIEYANKHERVSKDQFCYFVSDLLPEVEFGEVAMFMNDGSLTEYGLTEKKKFSAKILGTRE